MHFSVENTYSLSFELQVERIFFVLKTSYTSSTSCNLLLRGNAFHTLEKPSGTNSPAALTDAIISHVIADVSLDLLPWLAGTMCTFSSAVEVQLTTGIKENGL